MNCSIIYLFFYRKRNLAFRKLWIRLSLLRLSSSVSSVAPKLVTSPMSHYMEKRINEVGSIPRSNREKNTKAYGNK